jgi:hypothetical protein
MGYAICSVFLLALLAPALVRLGRSASGWLMAVLPPTLTAWFLSFLKDLYRRRPDPRAASPHRGGAGAAP